MTNDPFSLEANEDGHAAPAAGLYEAQLGTAPMLPLIMKMSMPAVAAQLVNLLYSVVDRIYIGHIPGIGTDALAGVGVTGSVILLIAAFSSVVGGGGAPLAAIALGQNDRRRAERILGNGMLLLIVFSLSTAFLAFAFREPLLRLTGASDNTIGYAMSYLSIYLVGTFFVMVATGLNPFISCQGRPGLAMGSVVLGAAINIALDPILIFACGMGVSGAALATVLSQGCSALWVLLFLTSRRASLSLHRKDLVPDGAVLRRMLGLGVSPFIMGSTESLIGFVLNGSLAVYGDIYVSALTVMQSCMQIVSVPLGGFAQGFGPIISYNYGRRSVDRVKDCYRISRRIMFYSNFAGFLCMICLPGAFGRLFTSDAALLEVICRYMPFFLAGMTVFGLQRTCQNTFVALGQAQISLFIALLRKVILLVPLALLLPHWLGVTGVYAAEAVADYTSATLCTIIFSVRFPRILRAVSPQE